jgi:hypothetical protein
MKEITALEAEKVTGIRLDRRRKYAISDEDEGQILFELYTIYTGKRREQIWIPCVIQSEEGSFHKVEDIDI